MSYGTISQCAEDPAFLNRVRACVAQEQGARDMAPNPQAYLDTFRWVVASASDVEAAYAYALDLHHSNAGGDPGVINDAMILAAIQGAWDKVFPPPPVMP